MVLPLRIPPKKTKQVNKSDDIPHSPHATSVTNWVVHRESAADIATNMKKIFEDHISWVGFDLGATLCDPRKAHDKSSKAIAARVMRSLEQCEERNGCPCGNTPVTNAFIRVKHHAIVSRERARGRLDNLPSSEFRRLCFEALLNRLDIEHSKGFIESLVKLETETYMATLEPNPDAIKLMNFIKDQGKMIFIVTDGLLTQSDEVLERLGIQPYIDFFATREQFRRGYSKSLVGQVIRYLKIDNDEKVLYVTDRLNRLSLKKCFNGWLDQIRPPCLLFSHPRFKHFNQLLQALEEGIDPDTAARQSAPRQPGKPVSLTGKW